MESFVVKGGKALKGELRTSSAKNCVLVQMAAAILTNEEVVIKNCPYISDVESMRQILLSLGAKVYWQQDALVINASGMKSFVIPEEYGRKIRSSVFMLGSLLGRFKHAGAVFPGGCSIGERPVDIHLSGFRSLNVKVNENESGYFCEGENMRSAETCVSGSVGATENLIMAAALLEGESIINGSAMEPEVNALCDMINSMGGKVTRQGSVIRVKGVKKLGGTEVKPIPDRIVSGTYIIAAAITNGEVLIKNAGARYLTSFIEKTDGYACDIKYYGENLFVKGKAKKRGVGLVETAPYPGFPTDLQAPLCSLLCISSGQSIIVERIFETRLRHVSQLKKMGADIYADDRTAYIRGVDALKGSRIRAYDLRGGAAMLLAALSAEGQSVVEDVRHIDRGYENIETQLKRVGASIERIKESII